MSQLVIVSDAFRGDRETVDLYCGESLASNFRRLWPHGIQGPWRVFRDVPSEENEIAALELPHVVVAPFQVFILARGVGDGGFFINLAISLALSYISTLLAPKPKPAYLRNAEQQESGTNVLTGQSNEIRLGARIPDILGRVRCYPDMLCMPLEDWWLKTQSIKQFFCVGRGDHDVPPDLVKLGETPIVQMDACTATVFHPLDLLPQMRVMRQAPEVQGISLLPDDASPSPLVVSFDAATKTMTSNTFRDLNGMRPITISSTTFNDGFFWVLEVPASSTVPPFTWVLSGPVVNETGANAAIQEWEVVRQSLDLTIYWGTASPYPPTPTTRDIRMNGGNTDWPMGAAVMVFDDAMDAVYGIVDYNTEVPLDIGSFHTVDTILRITDPNGVLTTVPPYHSDNTGGYQVFRPPLGKSTDGGVIAGPTDVPLPPVTSWYTCPMEEPDEIWVDFAFPQGLVAHTPLGRARLSIEVQVEFKRFDASDTQRTRTYTFVDIASQAPLRFTLKYLLETLDLPAGSPWIQVRVQRLTPLGTDTDNTYVEDTRWQRLAGIRILPARSYDNATTVLLSMTNTRGAVTMGETSLNMVVTRKLEHWNGSTFDAPAATDKWADNFVHRCRESDGANRTPEQIDLAGIYALQAQLDALDGGALGRIGLALDQFQDVDAELASIADVVRAVVYRVGKKIYVTRDQATATRIALFNGRTKNPDGESTAMRMTNDGENDSVTVTWVDPAASFKVREYTHPPLPISPQFNPLRAAPTLCNWAQAYRRAAYEWNRIRYRREQITVQVTEDGRICRPGDVVNITDDIANLAASAGEILEVSGTLLTLDRDVAFIAGHTYSIIVRDVEGQATDTIPVTAGAAPNQVILGRAPLPAVTIKPRDSSTGTLYAFFDDTAANIRAWMLTSVSANGPYVQLQGTNYSALVFQDDTGTIPDVPPLPGGPSTSLLGDP